MISAVTLKKFKCFQDEYFEFAPLTLFTGLNGSGKSTVIQSLLLLRQSNNERLLAKGLSLNGEYVNIGTGQDLLYEKTEGPEEIVISLEVDRQGALQWVFQYQAESNFLLSKNNHSQDSFLGLNLFNDQFEYLNAERFGPRSVYAKSNYIVAEHRHIGINGQFTQHFLHTFGDCPIANPQAAFAGSKEMNLINQVQAWLGIISPGVRIITAEYSKADLVGMQYRFIDSELSNTYRPSNVGFGITYGLPVIVALLKGKAGDLVIIENPEAHLHPSGQRKMGELISKVASGGVQVIIETHSDHILNGIRLSVKNKWIDKNDVQLNYLHKEVTEEGTFHKVLSPSIQEDGRLDYWPDGFFDEWDKALDEFF